LSRRAAAILLGTVFLIAIATLVLRRGSDGLSENGPAAMAEQVASGAVVPVDLFFPDNSGRLTTERRDVPQAREPEDRLRAILTELLAGPTAENRFPPLDPPVEIGAIHVTSEGVAYVDLISSEHGSPPVVGTRDELLTVYSLVNSLLLNTPEVEAIVLLWNGQQLESFAGHIDTTRPLVANQNL